jgi:hypothetical protein
LRLSDPPEEPDKFQVKQEIMQVMTVVIGFLKKNKPLIFVGIFGREILLPEGL